MTDEEVPPVSPEEPSSPAPSSLGMAVLVSVPFEVAKRIESFLMGRQIPCEVRRHEVEQAGPPPTGPKPAPKPEPYDSGMRHAARNLLKIRSTPPKLPDLALERDPRPLYDVLVREEDLPGVVGAGEAPGEPEMLEMVEGVAGELVVLCHLPWQEAWALASRLTDDGIPAVAVPEAGEDRETALERRVIPVAVRPEDLEAARAAVAR